MRNFADIERRLRDCAAIVLKPETVEDTPAGEARLIAEIGVLKDTIRELESLKADGHEEAARILEIAIGVDLLIDGTGGLREALARAEAAQAWLEREAA